MKKTSYCGMRRLASIRKERLMSLIAMSGVILFLVCMISSCGSSDSMKPSGNEHEFGPENHGLVMGLEISPENENQYRVKVRIKNIGERAVLLIGKKDKARTPELEQFFISNIRFDTYPEVGSLLYQTADMPEWEDVEYEFKPGKVFEIEWIPTEGRLKPKWDYGDIGGFPTEGMYSIHSTISFETKDGGWILLRSNEELVEVGASKEMPQHSMAKILAIDEEAQTARLNIGSKHKVHVNDVYQHVRLTFCHWDFTVIEVQPGYSITKMELITRLRDNDMDQELVQMFAPHVGMHIRLKAKR
ncbi:hypothetical protein JXA32_17405 [Candidatus Sumerlaeota bacterium]|nr:hypothetical protein [Candidatus Sumerlaeota bacterium]